MNFIPEQPKQAQDVPYFDDVSAGDGWQGHTTSKSEDTLKQEVMLAVQRLGGQVMGFQKGTFTADGKDRDGFRLNYIVEHAGGHISRGQMDIAALPVKQDYSLRRSLEKRRQQSLKMGLYMLRQALDGLWFLQQLSPGYAALMPWMLEAQSGKTVTQLWSESAAFGHLLPPGESDFVEGEFNTT